MYNVPPLHASTVEARRVLIVTDDPQDLIELGVELRERGYVHCGAAILEPKQNAVASLKEWHRLHMTQAWSAVHAHAIPTRMVDNGAQRTMQNHPLRDNYLRVAHNAYALADIVRETDPQALLVKGGMKLQGFGTSGAIAKAAKLMAPKAAAVLLTQGADGQMVLDDFSRHGQYASYTQRMDNPA